MSLTADERETIIRFDEASDTAHVYTTSPPTITKLKKNPAATLLREGLFERSAWAEFEFPKALLSYRTGQRVGRVLTDAERSAKAEHLARVRNNRKAQTPGD